MSAKCVKPQTELSNGGFRQLELRATRAQQINPQTHTRYNKQTNKPIHDWIYSVISEIQIFWRKYLCNFSQITVLKWKTVKSWLRNRAKVRKLDTLLPQTESKKMKTWRTSNPNNGEKKTPSNKNKISWVQSREAVIDWKKKTTIAYHTFPQPLKYFHYTFSHVYIIYRVPSRSTSPVRKMIADRKII